MGNHILVVELIDANGFQEDLHCPHSTCYGTALLNRLPSQDFPEGGMKYGWEAANKAKYSVFEKWS